MSSKRLRTVIPLEDYIFPHSTSTTVHISRLATIRMCHVKDFIGIWGGDAKIALNKRDYCVTLDTPMPKEERNRHNAKAHVSVDDEDLAIESESLRTFIAPVDQCKWASVLVDIAKCIDLCGSEPIIEKSKSKTVAIGDTKQIYLFQLEELLRNRNIADLHIFPYSDTIMRIMVDVSA